ncbi:MAG: sensor histidine kinase, partial [Hyphococcus sp.]
QVRKLSPRLISALDRAIVLSRNTLAYGRMEESVLSKSPVKLRDLAEEVLEDTAAMGVDARNAVDDSLTVTADRTQIYRSLFNLVRNSVEAMTANGADAQDASDAAHGSITIDAAKRGGAIEIHVADTGPGVPDHARDFLFEPFKGSKKPGGSGLGVAISAEIIRAHGGELRLKETGADGTTFEIVLPQ